METYVARQPIFNQNKEVYAYGVLYRDKDDKTSKGFDGENATSEVQNELNKKYAVSDMYLSNKLFRGGKMKQCPLYNICPLSDEILLVENNELIKEYLGIPGVLTEEGLTRSYKNKYCDNNHYKCARFQVAENLGLAAMPDNLLPHQNSRAENIIIRKNKILINLNCE